MTGRRAATVAVAGSLLLHGGAAVGLWLLVGAPAVVPPAQALPRLFVDLVGEPVVVSGTASAPAPVTRVRPAVAGPPAPAPSRAAATPLPPTGPPPTLAPVAPTPLAEIAPPPSPPAPPAVTASPPPPAPAGPVVVALVPAPASSGESSAPAPASPAPVVPGPAGGSTPAPGSPAASDGPGGAGASGTAAPTDAAPAPGSGAGPLGALPAAAPGGVPPEYDAYVRRLRERIQTRLQYPREAVRRGLHGVVELEIRIEPDGRLGQAGVVGGAPAPLLQRAALSAVEAATPAPFPPGVAARPLTIRLPVVFELR